MIVAAATYCELPLDTSSVNGNPCGYFDFASSALAALRL